NRLMKELGPISAAAPAFPLAAAALAPLRAEAERRGSGDFLAALVRTESKWMQADPCRAAHARAARRALETAPRAPVRIHPALPVAPTEAEVLGRYRYPDLRRAKQAPRDRASRAVF